MPYSVPRRIASDSGGRKIYVRGDAIKLTISVPRDGITSVRRRERPIGNEKGAKGITLMERKMVERRQALMGSSLGAQPFLPLVKGLAPRLGGEQR